MEQSDSCGLRNLYTTQTGQVGYYESTAPCQLERNPACFAS